MKKVLVAVADYPRLSGEKAMMFVHVRNLRYVENGISVTVLNFAVKESYNLDGINVISLSDFKKSSAKYDDLILHAANLRNHFLFLLKYGKIFQRYIFVYHGHEVLKINSVYPRPYDYMKNSGISPLIQNMYDELKCFVWKCFFTRCYDKSELIFVSNWILNEFKKNVRGSINICDSNVSVINNSVGLIFEKKDYDWDRKKEYDFITIRSNMDDSKYAVDLVVDLANSNRDLEFLLVGKGNYFEHYEKPDNLKWINRTLSHDEMLGFMDSSKCALLLTREDTQGVMTCECATYGMPVITSDIDVCKEIFSDFKNVKMINNNLENVDLKRLLIDLEKEAPYKKNEKYFYLNTVAKEIELIKG